MTTAPDKCPKCGASLSEDRFNQYACGAHILGNYSSPLCLMTQRANREHERAEKWKACAVELEQRIGCGCGFDGPCRTCCEFLNKFLALMEEEQSKNTA